MSVGHYENFPVASLLLPRPLREPVGVIYRFARTADDFADEGDDPPELRLKKLQQFRVELQGIQAGGTSPDPLFGDIARIVREYGLPLQLFHDLLDAFSQDVVKKRYGDFAEVLDYCRRSANPVGRLLLHLFGKNAPRNCELSDRICSALQIINFWQDVAIDFAKGRIYLPQDEMRRFGVGEEHLRQHLCDHAFQRLMRFQVDRARGMMLEGRVLVANLEGRLRLEIAITVQGGLRILEKLERAQYDMFRRRPAHNWLDWPLLFLKAL
ncbi:MAG TPA: squalene synthase HpnC [Burkholderiales bacterium]|nr:squalene synthase HpnC [Burkholderiales bacterium]